MKTRLISLARLTVGLMLLTVLLVAASWILMPGGALALNRLPTRAESVRVVHPCWRCSTPTPGAPRGMREFAPDVKVLSGTRSFESSARVVKPTVLCVLVEVKGPGGIRGLRCWNPSD